jgi:hypothetical protein
MSDPYATHYHGVESPSKRWAAITPHDTTALALLPKQIVALVAGNVTVVGDEGTSAVFKLNAGVPLAIRPSIVKATGTTATGIVALY